MHRNHTVSARRRAHQIPAGRRIRERRSQVAGWALAHGVGVDRDALAAIVGASMPHGDAPDHPALRTGVAETWTSESVGSVLWVGLLTWCRSNGAIPPDPDRVRSSLTAYVRYLNSERLLTPDSERTPALRRAITEHGRVGATDRRPARRRSTAPVVPIA
jgi:hypothetical protein